MVSFRGRAGARGAGPGPAGLGFSLSAAGEVLHVGRRGGEPGGDRSAALGVADDQADETAGRVHDGRAGVALAHPGAPGDRAARGDDPGRGAFALLGDARGVERLALELEGEAFDASRVAEQGEGAAAWIVAARGPIAWGARVRQGDSGSPVMDSTGRLVGLIVGYAQGGAPVAAWLPTPSSDVQDLARR